MKKLPSSCSSSGPPSEPAAAAPAVHADASKAADTRCRLILCMTLLPWLSLLGFRFAGPDVRADLGPQLVQVRNELLDGLDHGGRRLVEIGDQPLEMLG